MKNKIIISIFVSVLLIPQITFASWWNPTTWGIFKKKAESTEQTRRDFAPKVVQNNIATTTEVIKGILQGNVTIGPVCTRDIIEKYPTFSCTPTAEMYAAAKVFVYTPDKKTLVSTITPDKTGKFSINLPEGLYFVDMTQQRMGGTKGVPTTVKIVKDQPATLKLDVDTGLK